MFRWPIPCVPQKFRFLTSIFFTFYEELDRVENKTGYWGSPPSKFVCFHSLPPKCNAVLVKCGYLDSVCCRFRFGGIFLPVIVVRYSAVFVQERNVFSRNYTMLLSVSQLISSTQADWMYIQSACVVAAPIL